MGFLKFLGVALLLFVLTCGVLVFTVDSEFDVERSIVIDAAPAQVHAHIDDFDKWAAWSPFDKADETVVYTPGATSSGVGASRSWTSEASGSGSQTITKSDPEQGVWMDLVLEGDPAELAFTFEPVDGGTKVTWHDHFHLDGGMKLLGLVLDPLVLGPMFEQGLADLKEVVEAG